MWHRDGNSSALTAGHEVKNMQPRRAPYVTGVLPARSRPRSSSPAECIPRLRWLQVLPLLAVASCGSCGPERRLPDVVPDDAATRYAKAVCGAQARCGCIGEVFDDAAACEGAAIELFEAIAATPSLEFHDDCFESLLDVFTTGACDTDELLGYRGCQVFAGTVQAGGACTPEAQLIADWSPSLHLRGGLAYAQCSGQLECVDGRCGDAVKDLPLGAPCNITSGHHCANVDAMTPAGCGIDGVCHPGQADEGAACSFPHGCDDSVCAGLDLDAPDVPGVCTPYLQVGDACDGESPGACGTVGYCSAEGRCVEPWPSLCDALVIGPGRVDVLDWLPLE